MFNKKIVILLVLMSCLIGCKEKMTYSYLVQNPKVLKQEVMKCQINGTSTNATPECTLIMQAATDFMALLDEQQAEPEKFGQRVLDMEVLCATARESYLRAKQSVALLKEKGQTPEFETAQHELGKAQTLYFKARAQVKTLLAIISVTGPE